MAEKRMFAKTIIDSDAFLDMPLSTQALYFHLSMRADDEGFINNPKKILRMVCASEDDLKILCVKNFVIPFESGIVVIKHWRIHNYIRADRLVRTKYQDERSLLEVKDNGAYTIADRCQPSDSQMSVICQSDVSQLTDKRPAVDGQVTDIRPADVSIDKISIDKISIEKNSVGKATAHPRKTKASQNLENLKSMTIDARYQNAFEDAYPGLERWILYKGEKGFTYTQTGLQTLALMACRNVEQYGAQAVDTVIDMSIANGYQGIVWDRLQKGHKPQGKQHNFAERTDDLDEMALAMMRESLKDGT